MHRSAGRLVPLAILCICLSCLGPAAHAGPASDLIAKLNAAFIGVMQNAKTLGYDGRYKTLEPTLSDAYDFPEMTRVSTGRHWRELTDPQKQQLVAAFKDYSLATYAARFDGFGGEHFEILDEEQAPGGNLRVNNQIVVTSGPPIRIDYLLRQTAGQWRIIDVYLKSSVSELAVRRSEFTSVLGKQGVKGLIATLNDKTAAMEKSGDTAAATSN